MRERPLRNSGEFTSRQPLGAGALIRWLLANGYTMLQIRTMFPGWFLHDPAPGG